MDDRITHELQDLQTRQAGELEDLLKQMELRAKMRQENGMVR